MTGFAPLFAKTVHPSCDRAVPKRYTSRKQKTRWVRVMKVSCVKDPADDSEKKTPASAHSRTVIRGKAKIKFRARPTVSQPRGHSA